MFRDQRVVVITALLLLILIWSTVLPWRTLSRDKLLPSSNAPIPNPSSEASSDAHKPAPYHGNNKNNNAQESPQRGIEKATILMLVRNRELFQAIASMRQLEDRFNRNYNYPWTFLNDEEFTEEFKNLTTSMASGRTQYALIPKEHWSLPESIDKKVVETAMNEMNDKGVAYATSWSYRHMCRFNSGFFFLQDILKEYDWYFRVEPGVQYWCDMDYDPFTFMRENNKLYGWVVTITDIADTIPTLWKTSREFFKQNLNDIHPRNSMKWLMTEPEKGIDSDYNTCHFWSNFEIASLNFFRSDKYMRFFKYLDDAKGFFYERWGDAPVHSIAVGMMLDRDQIHRFDIGYEHPPYKRCNPAPPKPGLNKCLCPAAAMTFENVDTDHRVTCVPQWMRNINQDKPEGEFED